jgi:hypothetical protein
VFQVYRSAVIAIYKEQIFLKNAIWKEQIYYLCIRKEMKSFLWKHYEEHISAL